MKRVSERDRKILASSVGTLLALLLGALLCFLLFPRDGGGGGSGGGSGGGQGRGEGAGAGPGDGGGAADAGDFSTNASAAATNAIAPRPAPPRAPLFDITNKMSMLTVVRPESSAPPVERGGGGLGGSGQGRGTGSGDGAGSGRGKPMGTGDVSFRIYWTPASDDIDLHVIDPNGHHLWYKATNCVCRGELDRDDTTSGGPENIYWPTGQGPAGTYTYYALYYAGNGPKRVRIELRKNGQVIGRHAVALQHVNEESEHFTYEHNAAAP